jgi:hypothetical protein
MSSRYITLTHHNQETIRFLKEQCSQFFTISATLVHICIFNADVDFRYATTPKSIQTTTPLVPEPSAPVTHAVIIPST